MPDPLVTVSPASAIESEYITFTITLSEPVIDSATLDYQILSGTAERNEDVHQSTNGLEGRLTFRTGEDTATIRLRASWESLDELDEHFILRLINPNGVSLGRNVHSLTTIGWIEDDDGPGLNRALAVSAPIVREGAGSTASFTVSLSEPFDTDRSFAFRTEDGTAKAGSDYVAQDGIVTFLAGQTVATIDIALRNDRTAEGTETFNLSITGAHNVVGTTGVATIADDDVALPVAWVEGEAVTESNYMKFTVHLSEAASDAVTVDYNLLNGSGTRNDDVYGSSSNLMGTVTFAPGETSKIITFRANWESLDELDESVQLQLFNPVGATFGTNVHSPTAIGWVLDDDGPGNNRAIDVSDIVVTEAAGGKAIFTVSLSQAFDVDRSFSFTTADGSATSKSDYVARAGTVMFRAGQTEAHVEVDLRNDRVAEAGERFELVVRGAHGVNGATGTALIMDDDARQPIITIDGAAVEEGNYLVHTVRLSKPAADAVTVGYTTISGSATVGSDLYASTSPLAGTVTFAPGETTQHIILRANWESTDELDESYFIRLHEPSGAGFGGNNRSITATGWVHDDDGPGLNRTVSVSGAEVREGADGRVAVFAVELSTAATTDLTLRFATVAGTAKAGADFVARSGNITFAAGQTRIEIPVTIRNDMLLEDNEQFSLRVVPPFPGSLSSSATTAIGTATIIDGTIRGNDGANRLIGTDLADRIEGFGGRDVIYGRAGNDIISGGTGNDRLYGEAGRDSLIGGAGADLLDGGSGRDTLVGGSGNDRYVVDRLDRIVESRDGGIDTVIARHSMTLGKHLENLQLRGNADLRGTGNSLANELTGNAGNNVLNGRAGHDTLSGGAGRDSLIGGAGNDVLLGGSGNDTLMGGSGRDRLRGDLGTDLLYGGADAQRDVFVFRTDRDSAVGAARDRIYDFRSGVDDIDLSGIDANEDRRGNQAFQFTGRTADEYSVWYVKKGANVIVRGDNDGDGRADFEILVAGVARLTADDFLL